MGEQTVQALAEMEEGRKLASEREDLIAQGVDPAELEIPLAPVTSGNEPLAAADPDVALAPVDGEDDLREQVAIAIGAGKAHPRVAAVMAVVLPLLAERDAYLAQLERYDGQAYEDITAERDDYRAMWRDREGYLADELARLDQVRALAAGAVEALPGPDDVRTCSMPVAYLLGIKEAAGPVRTLDAAPADEGGGG